jgi:hypothetical protein
MRKPSTLHGECLCRRVAYQLPDAFEYALMCHCSNCRRATGSAFKPFGGIRSEELKIVRGENLITRFGEGANYDAHCGLCGSLLYSLVREGDYVHVTLGTLLDPPSTRPTAHIFVGSKAPWDLITDTLPQFEELPSD